MLEGGVEDAQVALDSWCEEGVDGCEPEVDGGCGVQDPVDAFDGFVEGAWLGDVYDDVVRVAVLVVGKRA